MKPQQILLLAILAGMIAVLCLQPLHAQNIEVVYVPPVPFTMGDTYAEGGADELPTRSVTPSTGFLIGQYEITNAQYAAALTWALNRSAWLPSNEDLTGPGGAPYTGGPVYVNGQKAIEVDDPTGICQIVYQGGAFTWKTRSGQSMRDHPVLTVTWYGALAFCNWQSRRDGLELAYSGGSINYNRTSSNGYRLPSEAEWEMAAAHDPTTSTLSQNHWRYGYAGNQDISFAWANVMISGQYNNPLPILSMPYTAPVGFFDGSHVGSKGQVQNALSHYGCYDMSGNVAEWVQDIYAAYGASTPTDGSPYQILSGPNRVIRGGSWLDNGFDARSAARDWLNPASGTTSGTVGFRIARTDTAPPSIPLLVSLSPSIIARNQVLSGQVITINGFNFSPASLSNEVLLNTSSANLIAAPFNASPIGTSLQFRVPVAIMPATFTEPLPVSVRVRTNGKLSTNTLILTILPEGSIPPDTELVAVPEGIFEIGDPWNEGAANEQPLHPVAFNQRYAIGKYEVTNSQFANALNWALANPSKLEPAERITGPGGAPYDGGPVYVSKILAIDVDDDNGWCQITYSNGTFSVKGRDNLSMNDHPVVMVSWFGAAVYCNWKSVMEGANRAYDFSALVPVNLVTGAQANTVGMFSANAYAALTQNATSANGYRLPSEAEWERAAAYNPSSANFNSSSANSYHTRYGYGSDIINTTHANYYDDQAELYGNPVALSTFPFTSPVGFFNGINIGLRSATEDSHSYYGCYDMSGNVYEWCQDWLHASYAGAPADGSAWESPVTSFRVLRGGAWDLAPYRLRATYRAGSSPFNRYMTIGFRVAKTLPPLPPQPPTAARDWIGYR